ncbi:hypothetical protein HXX76_007619 [Chlamydomonas incerta]|uniref:Protein kinase domain-containing protein n=1 Tax=Chlamydomonas incerta TaxID=51695 RepID=A0A835W2J9_CHLIN|nr:hypothetical protein HXX76_007619 [Chlamydomonas incerta]|eukprot:KAG2434729.1 hypothetical protein HXX76_007619 [Chlamydomonas incerta]
MVYDKCLIKRLIGLPYEDAIRNAQSLLRPEAFPGTQVVEIVNNLTLLTSEPAPYVVARGTLLTDYAGYVPIDTSMASQGLFFGGYDVWIHGPSYFLNDYFVNATCLATRPSNECVALLLNDIELDKARQAAQQQAGAADSGDGDGKTATIVVAVVVPVGTVLLAALVGSVWWVRRSRRRELEQLQRAKAAAKAADIEAGGSQEKTGSGGARLGLMAGGVKSSGGGVFMGVDGENDLPQWSEAAHHEADDVGHAAELLHTATPEPTGHGRLRGSVSGSSSSGVEAGTWQGLPVAIKTVVFTANQESRRHALKEAALCQSISHPNIIATYASELQPIGVLPSATTSERLSAAEDTPPSSQVAHLNITDWRLYIIQEFADGGPLGGLYGHPALWLSPGVVNLPAILPLALGIARALEHLHSKRIVHGDLNPNNVLLKRDPAEPSGYAVKVGDFGLSVMLPTDRTHLSNICMGTMFYICPAVACKGHVGPPADVFSLGVLLWELYHGRRAGIRAPDGPRYCSNFPSYPPGCPEGYRAITLHCLQRQPQSRPDAVTIAGALQHLLVNIGAA